MNKDSNFEPLKNDVWSLEFTAPDSSLEKSCVNPIKIQNGFVKSESSFDKIQNERLCRKIQKDIDEKLDISFSVRDSDNSVQQFINKWIELYQNSLVEKITGDKDSLMSFFDYDENDSDATHMSWRLKKPLDELTDDEKKRIKRLLSEITDIDTKKFDELFN